jgi:hypothetical protein
MQGLPHGLLPAFVRELLPHVLTLTNYLAV